MTTGPVGTDADVDTGARWLVRGERAVYRSPWVTLSLSDVELPTRRRISHHVVRIPPSAAVAIVDRGHVLMAWRHRFITDTWAWELPGGMVEPGETPAQAAAREVEEETGWRPGPLVELCYVEAHPGICDSAQFVYRADEAVLAGPPTDPVEVARLDWVPLADVVGLLAQRRITAAATQVGLLSLLAAGG